MQPRQAAAPPCTCTLAPAGRPLARACFCCLKLFRPEPAHTKHMLPEHTSLALCHRPPLSQAPPPSRPCCAPRASCGSPTPTPPPSTGPTPASILRSATRASGESRRFPYGFPCLISSFDFLSFLPSFFHIHTPTITSRGGQRVATHHAASNPAPCATPPGFIRAGGRRCRRATGRRARPKGAWCCLTSIRSASMATGDRCAPALQAPF